MASLAPGLSNISFEDYFVKKLGLTKDLRRVASYHQTFQEKGGIPKHDIAELAKIAKYPWEPYMDKPFAIKVAREVDLRTVKITGFLAYGKVLLQDVMKPSVYIIASFKEVVAALEAH